METSTRVSIEKASETVKVFSKLMMGRSMKVLGAITKCMEEAEKPFQMENALLFTIRTVISWKP